MEYDVRTLEYVDDSGKYLICKVYSTGDRNELVGYAVMALDDNEEYRLVAIFEDKEQAAKWASDLIGGVAELQPERSGELIGFIWFVGRYGHKVVEYVTIKNGKYVVTGYGVYDASGTFQARCLSKLQAEQVVKELDDVIELGMQQAGHDENDQKPEPSGSGSGLGM